MLRRILGFFLNGIIFIVPIAITVFIIYRLFIFLDGLLPVEKQFPGSGLIILVAVVTLMGFLGSTFVATPIRNWFNSLIDRIPLVKTLYSSITDLLSAFVGQKKRFNQPVLVKLSREAELERIGFVTDDDLMLLDSPKGKVAVYFPHSYSYTGNVFIIPKSNITPIDKNSSEVMKYIVSGGVAEIDEEP
ncbi:MAG: DUF502 domain-containing protein [Flavobacteriales bacterium]|nr:DUF502 domain-containing protein [Flavobacteriales bacterium]